MAGMGCSRGRSTGRPDRGWWWISRLSGNDPIGVDIAAGRPDHRRQAPAGHRAFGYGLRWGIEPVFPDFRTRGFGIGDSHIQRTDRLIPAVSVGMGDVVDAAAPGREKPSERRPRSLTPPFRRGIRRVRTCLQRPIPLSPLRAPLREVRRNRWVLRQKAGLSVLDISPYATRPRWCLICKYKRR